MRRIVEERSGQMPTTSVRRRILGLWRSLGLLDQIWRQIPLGKAVKATQTARLATRGVGRGCAHPSALRPPEEVWRDVTDPPAPPADELSSESGDRLVDDHVDHAKLRRRVFFNRNKIWGHRGGQHQTNNSMRRLWRDRIICCGGHVRSSLNCRKPVHGTTRKC